MSKFYCLLLSLLLCAFSAHAQQDFSEKYAKRLYGFQFWTGASKDASSYGHLRTVRKGTCQIIGNSYSDILEVDLPDKRFIPIIVKDCECSIQDDDIIISWRMSSPYTLCKVRFVRGDVVYLILENANGDSERIPIKKIFNEHFKNGQYIKHETFATDNIFNCIQIIMKNIF